MTVPGAAFRKTYRNESALPFCPGCGHDSILRHLDAALVKLQIDPSNIVLVTDIGCCGLSDEYFATNAFHGLHGRSITYATGMKLARPDLKVIVLIGDGGTGIGAAHLLNAARRNIGLTVLVFNNLNFGMTGGQHSTTTPTGAITSTSLNGHLERPFDLCATVAANGANYVWRGTSFCEDLAERIAEAVQSECFALLDIWELCTAHFGSTNRWSKKSLLDAMAGVGMKVGMFHRAHHPEFASAYRVAMNIPEDRRSLFPRPHESRFRSPLDRPFRLVVAGSAGGRVRSTTRLLGEAALLAGLYAVQRDDFPVTVRTGHSVSELMLSPRQIEYTGAACPDAVVLLSVEGIERVASRMAIMPSASRVFALSQFAERIGASCEVEAIDRAQVRLKPETSALYAVAYAALKLSVVSTDALEAAVKLRTTPYMIDELTAIAAANRQSALPANV